MDPVTECTIIIALLSGVVLYFAWQLKKFQDYHIKRVLELLEEKHEVQKEKDLLEREKFDLKLTVARRADELQRAHRRIQTLNVSLDRAQMDFRQLLEISLESQAPPPPKAPKGAPRLRLITEDD